MSAPRILIVDKDVPLTQTLSAALRLNMSDVRVNTTESAEAALGLIAGKDYDVIITAIEMPGINGPALLSEIRTRRPKTPIVLLAEPEQRALALEALSGGAYDFVEKPINRDHFVAAVGRARQMRDLGRQVEEQRTALERQAVELERTVAVRTRELRETNRIKDEFLATLSHELRTPLTAILGWVRLLRAGKLEEEVAARALETIERNATTQAQMIEDILDVSRIITGKLRLNLREVELPPIVEAAVEAIRPAAEAKALTLELKIESMEGFVMGDSARLQQIVWNLLTNAVKFTPSGGRVEVRLEGIDSEPAARKKNQKSQTPTAVVKYGLLRVSDTGQGISPDFLPYVFDRFRQADSSSERSHSGLGIGLAIVRHLAELHGGTVRAESPGEGQGAAFEVRMPLRAGTATPVEWVATDELFADVDEDRPGHSAVLGGLRVLVVDDEADTRDFLTTMLEQNDAEVTAVGSAAEALKVLNHWRPDVVLSDIGMPGEDGYSLIRKIRALETKHGWRIPAAALTAYARSEDRTRALSAGFQTHVAKPIEPDELTAIVAGLAGRKLS